MRSWLIQLANKAPQHRIYWHLSFKPSQGFVVRHDTKRVTEKYTLSLSEARYLYESGMELVIYLDLDEGAGRGRRAKTTSWVDTLRFINKSLAYRTYKHD